MIERAFARTLRNYSTIFMVVAVLTFPVHALYTFVFNDVIATRDFHEAIETGPASRKISGVGPDQLGQARIAFWVITLGELALLPLAVRATRRVLLVDEEGGVPTAPDAWKAALSPGVPHLSDRTPGGAVVLGVAAGVAVGLLVYGIGSGVSAFLPEDLRWVGIGLSQAAARAGGAPLALGPIALFRAKETGSSAPKF